MGETKPNEQLAACKAALKLCVIELAYLKKQSQAREGGSVWTAWKEGTNVLAQLAAADETPPQSGVALDGPISASASNARIAELEQALRESTGLLGGLRRHMLDAMTEDEAADSRSRITANERLLKGGR